MFFELIVKRNRQFERRIHNNANEIRRLRAALVNISIEAHEHNSDIENLLYRKAQNLIANIKLALRKEDD